MTHLFLGRICLCLREALMEDLFFLHPGEVSDFVRTIDLARTDEVFGVLRVAIDEFPAILPIVKQFIFLCTKSDHSYTSLVAEHLMAPSDDFIAAISRKICASYLGATLPDSPVSPKYAIFEGMSFPAIDFSIIDVALGKINPGCIPSHSARLPVFMAYATIQKLAFNKQECAFRLNELFSNEEIITAMLVESSLPGLGMAVVLSTRKGFLDALLDYIHLFPMRKEILSLIFTAYYGELYNPHIRYEPLFFDQSLHRKFRNSFDSSTIQFCSRIASLELLSKFLGRDFQAPKFLVVERASFLNSTFHTREEFFKAFIDLTSPSPTHFLSYLEYLKDKFVLSADEQGLFTKMLKAFHTNNPVYLEVVLDKMLLFGIISEVNIL